MGTCRVNLQPVLTLSRRRRACQGQPPGSELLILFSTNLAVTSVSERNMSEFNPIFPQKLARMLGKRLAVKHTAILFDDSPRRYVGIIGSHENALQT